MGVTASIQPDSTITGPTLSELVEVHAITPKGTSGRNVGVDRRTGAPYNAVLTADQLAAPLPSAVANSQEHRGSGESVIADNLKSSLSACRRLTGVSADFLGKNGCFGYTIRNVIPMNAVETEVMP